MEPDRDRSEVVGLVVTSDAEMADELWERIESLEDLLTAAELLGMKAVEHKLQEALGPLRNAAGAAEQYRDGVLTYD